jgi:hypothetical protein
LAYLIYYAEPDLVPEGGVLISVFKIDPYLSFMVELSSITVMTTVSIIIPRTINNAGQQCGVLKISNVEIQTF